MAFVSVINCCLDSIREISEELEGAIIYLDAGCTESFKFLGAFPILLEMGVLAVCSLESMSSLDMVIDWNGKSDDRTKVVFFTSRLLSDAHRYILRCLSTLQRVFRCTIYTAISEIGHSAYPDSPLGPDAYHEYQSFLAQDYEELMKKNNPNSVQNYKELKENPNPGDEGWLQLTPREMDITKPPDFSGTKDTDDVDRLGHAEDVGQKLIASVHHFPLTICPFSPKFFVLPSEGSIAEAYLSAEQENAISSGLPPLSTGTFSDGEDIPAGVTLTAQFLYHLTTKMDLKLEIFSLGDLSRTVGKLVTDMSSLYDVGRRKRSAGLLLIDRTVDLLTPCCHGDSLVDRIFSSVPRRTRTSSGQVKGSQTQLRHRPANILHAPLDVQIPLAEVLKEVPTIKNVQLLETIEAFLQGWNLNDSATQIDTVVNLANTLHGENGPSLESELLSGSLASTDSFHGTPYLEAILDRRTKDGATLIKKWLQETLHKERINVHPKTQLGSELQLMIRALAKNQSFFMRNKGIIQLAAAVSYAMGGKHRARWDSFISAEKILNISAGDTSQSLSSQMCDIINKSSLMQSHGQRAREAESSQGLFSLEDALLLTVTGYILAGENFPTSGSAGPFSWQEEHFLKEAIVDAILENPEVAKLKFLHGLFEDLEANLKKKRDGEAKERPSKAFESDDFEDDQWGSWGEEDADTNTSNDHVYSDIKLKLELRDRVDNLFKFLHKLTNLKGNKVLREVTMNWESGIGDDPYSRKGLLYKLLTRILSKNDVPGLEYHSSTVGRLFKSGFGRLGLGQAKPSLSNQNIILVFVVGGMNAIEVLEAQEALVESGRLDIELVLGGTTLLTPANMLDLLLGDSSYI